MTDANCRTLAPGDRVRVLSGTPRGREWVGWVVRVVEVALDDGRDVAGVLVAFVPEEPDGLPFDRGWGCWRRGRDVERVDE